MNFNFYPPSLQRKLAEEVLYLHSLWHSSTTPIHNPSPNPNPNANSNPNLGVTHSTSFKKPRKLKPTNKEIEWPVLPTPPKPVSDFAPWPDSIPKQKPVPLPEWPVLPEPPEPASAVKSWPDSVPKPKPVPVPEEAKRKPDVIQLQKLAVKLSKDYFAKGDEDSSEDEDEDEDEVEADAFEFFKGLFEKDEKLRECCQKYWENGEFCCLVCVGIGVKVSKRYKDCVALLQHAVTVLKTKKKGAHRGFGRAICGLLGWNFERLPSIVLAVDECSKKEVEKEEQKADIGQNEAVDEIINLSDEEQKADIGQNKAINEIINLSDDVKEDYSNAAFLDATKPKEHEAPNDNNHDVISKKEGCISADQKSQQNSLNICCEFLAKSEDESSSDDECDKKELATRESIAFKFFSSIFARDADLRNYYEQNHVEGKFYCLVCGAIGTKKLKPFDNCYRLVQHTRGVTLMKRRWAHLAFGKVVCQVLGWDVPLPSGLGLRRMKNEERESGNLLM